MVSRENLGKQGLELAAFKSFMLEQLDELRIQVEADRDSVLQEVELLSQQYSCLIAQFFGDIKLSVESRYDSKLRAIETLEYLLIQEKDLDNFGGFEDFWL